MSLWPTIPSTKILLRSPNWSLALARYPLILLEYRWVLRKMNGMGTLHISVSLGSMV